MTGKLKGFYKEDGKTKPITARVPHGHTLQKGNANLGIPKKFCNEKLKAEKLKEAEKQKTKAKNPEQTENNSREDEEQIQPTQTKHEKEEQDEWLRKQLSPKRGDPKATPEIPTMPQNVNEQEQQRHQEMINESIRERIVQKASHAKP